MTVRSTLYLMRLASAVTEEQAAVVLSTVLDEGVRPLRDVLEAGLAWCDENEPQRIGDDQ